MGSQWSKDGPYRKAIREGYRSRAAYKLLEIQERYSIIRDDDNVVDLGCAPGCWLQVVTEHTHGMVLGVDLQIIAPVEGARIIVGDISDPHLKEIVTDLLGIVNIVLCDASPNLSGQSSYDQARAIGLGEDALNFAREVLKTGGNMVIKSFQGEDFHDLLVKIKRYFYSVKTFKTKATRKGSREIYIIAKNFCGKEGCT